MQDVASSLVMLREQAVMIVAHWCGAIDAADEKTPHERWTRAQVLEHLTITQNQYVGSLLDAAHRSSRALSTGIPAGTLVGRLLRWSLDAVTIVRFPAPAGFRPGADVDARASQQRFTNDRERLEVFLSTRDMRDLAEIRLVSPADSRIKLNAIDAVDVLLAHERRHLRQLDARV